MTIMRLWHGEVPIEKADAYETFMLERAAPDYASVNGLLDLSFQRRDEEHIAHFLLVTVWDCVESVKRFAGDNVEVAKYYPEDDGFLLKKETFTSMYEVFYRRRYE